MNEHKPLDPSHIHIDEINIDEHQTPLDAPDKSDSAAFRAIGGSIIIGAILVCASIFYNTRVIVKALPSLQVQAGTGAAQAPAPAPAGPVTIQDRNNEPFLGNKDAKVTVVEFADFQCPFCQRFFNDTFSQIKEKYIDTGKIKYVYRHFPLTAIHANAEIAGVAAECANQQDKFWEYHDLLFKNGQGDGTGLTAPDLKKYADGLGLNKGTLGFGNNKFNKCLDDKATLKIVQDDLAEGTKDGVTGTPAFFVNGLKISGAQPFAKFEQAIDAALK